MKEPILRLEEVSLAAPVGSTAILSGISCAIAPYTRVVLLGASGSGKTSLLRLLNRLSEPTQGVITLESQPLNQIAPLQLRRKVALVPQEPKLLGMTVAEALAYPLVLQKFPRAEIQARVRRWRDRLQLPDSWSERTELQLSQGQRQLCAIARSLILEPKILLLDEPTAALDFGSAARLLEVLGELTTNREMTVLMVNHSLEQSEAWCDRALYLEAGQLRQDAARDRLDWQALRATLQQLQTRQQEEWG